MAFGTELNLDLETNFPFLPQFDVGQLNIKIDLGYIYIKPRNSLIQNFISQSVNNPYHPPAGGKQGESFVNNDVLKKLKSINLNVITNGVIPTPMEPSGAPFCTFVEGTITSQKLHPYYDLIIAPENEKGYSFSGSANFSISQPLIQQNVYRSIDSDSMNQFNKLGTPFIPSTTKTSDSVKGLKDSGKIQPLTTYNIWSVDNIGQNVLGSASTQKINYFDLVEFLGFVPKSGTQSKNLQPYAQTWPYTDSAQIQVYASNSQVSLTRKYSICLDYAHHDKKNSPKKVSKYLIYKNYKGSEKQLDVREVGLNNDIPVGFTIVFSSIVVSNTIPTGDPTNSVLTEPRLLISWGALNNANKHTSKNRISLYTLEISPNRSPRLYFNINSNEILNKNIDPNHNFIELTTALKLNATERNTQAKTPNKFTLYVYYSGPFLYIGAGSNSNDTSPDKWQTIKNQDLQIKNGNQNVSKRLNHYLDKDSKINISAQFMNFTFMYGPPLFNPHDDQNIPGLTYEDPLPENNSANSYNLIQGQYLSNDDNEFKQQEFNQSVEKFIRDNSAFTFEEFNNQNSNGYIGGAASYLDARATNPSFICKSQIPQDSLDFGKLIKYKVSFPKDLGGHVYSKFFHSQTFPEPDIKSSYVTYLNDVFDDGTTVSSILTQAVISDGFIINKSVDTNTLTNLSSKLKISFVNLNRSEFGNQIINFMRQNVAVLKVSAGYGDNNVRVQSDIRAPILYDLNDTNYYLNPNSTSSLYKVNIHNNIEFTNYGRGMIGTYTSTRYQAVFAMGSSYVLPDDGSTTGTLYGLAWSHPNAGGVASNLNTHGLLAMENGTWLASVSGSIRCRDDMRAPIYYDNNNTAYYVDPNSTSNLLGLTVTNTISGNITGSSGSVSGLTLT